MHIHPYAPNNVFEKLTRALIFIILSRFTCFVVEEPGNFHETASGSESAGCEQSWLWDAPFTDFVEALASNDFVNGHVSPCVCVRHEGISNQLLALKSKGSASLKFCLPEHPWFSRGGSGFQIEASATVVAMSAVRQALVMETLAPALACAGLLALINRILTIPQLTVESALKKAGTSLLSSDGSLGLSSDGPGGIVLAVVNAANSRWATCMHELFVILGSIICEKDVEVPGNRYAHICSQGVRDVHSKAAPPDTSSKNVLQVDPTRTREWAQWASENLIQGEQRRSAHEENVSESDMSKLLATAVGTTYRYGKLKQSISINQSTGRTEFRPLSLCLRHDESIPSPWHIHLGDGFRPVVHVLAASAVPESKNVMLELLVYVDGGSRSGQECLAAFSVGACRSLSRFSLLTWQCEFSMPGHDSYQRTQAVAVSHFGSEVLLRCPLPNLAVSTLRSTRRLPKGHVFSVSLVAGNEPSWSSATPLPICLLQPGRPWRHTVQARKKNLLGMVGCSAPMWLAHDEHGHLVEQWLAYHKLIGFDKFVVYDLDGSLAEAVAPFVADGFAIYIPWWPHKLSPGACTYLHDAKTLDGEEPAWAKYCTQTQAEAHCVWNMRGRARWVMLVHSFDAFAASSNGLREGINPLLSSLESNRSQIAALGVTRFDFGGVSEGTGVAPTRFYWRQRRPLLLQGERREFFDFMSSEGHNHAGAILVNPENIWSMLTHWARGRPGSIHLTLPPEVLRLNHYVDVLGSPRCATAAASGGDPPCDVFDNSSAWISDYMSCNYKPRTSSLDGAAHDRDLHHKLLVVVPGHGDIGRTKILLTSLRRLRSEPWTSVNDFACLIFVYNYFSDFLTSDSVKALREVGCVLVLQPACTSLEVLTDPATMHKMREMQPRYVLLLLDDILLGSERPFHANELMNIMHRNQLDVVSALPQGEYNHTKSKRASTAVGRITTFITWKAPLFTAEAFGALCRMVRPKFSSTSGYEELYPSWFQYEFGRLPQMGIVETMLFVQTGQSASTTLEKSMAYSEKAEMMAFYRDRFNITPNASETRCGYLS